MRGGVVACGLALLAGPLAARAGDSEAERARLEGVWSFARVEVEGVQQPPPPFETNKLIVSA
jgi:hypothetical protein